MGVADLPRWAWLVAGLLVGLVHGSVREWSGRADPLEAYPVLLTDQRQFEHALVAERHGHRLFKDITVYPHWTNRGSTGGKVLVHLVTGMYWDGRAEVKDGAARARWEPACYVAPIPYRPLSSDKPEAGSVVDFLDELRRTRGVESRYAWWWWMRLPLVTSSLGGVLLIGVCLPSALSLVAYGTILPPPREKRPSLWRVRNPRRAAAKPAAPVTVAIDTRPEEPAAAPPPPVATDPAPPPLKPLTAEEVSAVPVPHEEKHFGAGREDFYPTELRVPHPPVTDK